MCLTVGQFHEEVDVQVIIFKAFRWDCIDRRHFYFKYRLFITIYSSDDQGISHLSLHSSRNAGYLQGAKEQIQ